VGDSDSVLEHHFRDEEATMALGRILLTAHHRHTAPLDAPRKALDTAAERLAGGNLPVQDVSVLVVELGALRTPAQLSAQKQVLRSGLLDDIRQIRTIGPFDESGMRPRPHIHQDLYSRIRQERAKVLLGVIRVPDGQQGSQRTRHK
jgi:hypothetical protein